MLRRHHTAALALTLAASLVLAACGDDKVKDGDELDSQQVAGGSELGQTWPLTGLDVNGDQSSAQKHPVMVVKIDNTASSAPQEGLGEADLVVEELVEGGSTRLAAFFYSAIPDVVGPVRSMRASDIGIVSPVGATMVTSGAAAVTINRIKDAGIDYYAEGDEGFYRDDSRHAPYNLMAHLDETTAAASTEEDARPGDYLPWGDAKDLPAGQPAATVNAIFSGGHTTTWRFDGGEYVNDNSNADADGQFPADTVLVLRVEVGDAGYTDPAGNPVPETRLEGTGPAMIFHDGRLVRGTWSKKDLTSAIQLSTKAGELTVPAGHTWIELVPVDGGDVTFTKK